MRAPRWMKYIKDALAFDAKVNAAVTKDKTQIVAVTAIATADATDLASAIALANEAKAKFNTLLAAIKA